MTAARGAEVVRLVSQEGGRARTAVFCYAQGMNDVAETKRLAEAINALASVVAEKGNSATANRAAAPVDSASLLPVVKAVPVAQVVEELPASKRAKGRLPLYLD